MIMFNQKHRAVSALILATFFYGLYGIFSRLIGIDFGVFSQHWMKMLLVGFMTGSYIFLRKKWTKIDMRDVIWLTMWSSIGAIAIICFFIAANTLRIGILLFVFYAGSILSGFIVGSLFFQEKFTRQKIISILFCLGGVSLIYSVDIDLQQSRYLGIALLSGFTAGIWYTFSKKLSKNYAEEQLLFVDSTIQAIIAFLIASFLQENAPPVSFSTPWISIILFALAHTLGNVLVIYGFKHTEAHLATLVMPLEVFFGALLGFIFFKEILSIFIILGGLLIIVGFIFPHLKLQKSFTFSQVK